MAKQLTPKELKKLIDKNPISKEISEEAREILVFKCQELIERGDFEPIDLDILTLYAMNIVNVRKVDADLEREGSIYSYKDRYGNLRIAPHPLIKIRKDLVEALHRTAKLFGFSPLDSQALPPKPSKELQEWDKQWGSVDGH